MGAMQYADWNGVRLAYDTAGAEGSPVLLVMGYTMPGRAWIHQIPTLAKAHRVAWFDHRGVGETRAPAGAYTIAQLAEDSRRLLDHLGWDRAHVVGVSMGGMVAQELALAEPERLRSLTLIATHAGGGLARVPPLTGLACFVEANLGPRARRLRAVQRLLFPDEFLGTCDQAWLTEVMRADFGTPIPLRYRLSQLAAVLRHGTAPRLAGLGRIPTLVVKPSRDVLIRPQESDRLARLIPGARLLTFDDAGHGVIRQHHETLNRALLEHFAASDATRG